MPTMSAAKDITVPKRATVMPAKAPRRNRKKPSRADARPARSPKGASARAIADGVMMAMPKVTRAIGPLRKTTPRNDDSASISTPPSNTRLAPIAPGAWGEAAKKRDTAAPPSKNTTALNAKANASSDGLAGPCASSRGPSDVRKANRAVNAKQLKAPYRRNSGCLATSR
jgi:hypothetical protein